MVNRGYDRRSVYQYRIDASRQAGSKILALPATDRTLGRTRRPVRVALFMAGMCAVIVAMVTGQDLWIAAMIAVITATALAYPDPQSRGNRR